MIKKFKLPFNFLIYLLNESVSKILPFLTLLIAAKYIEVDSFGLLTMYYVTLEILTLIINNNIRATTRIDYFQCSRDEYIKKKSAHHVGTVLICIFIFITLLPFDIVETKLLLILIIISFMRGIAFFVLSDLQCSEKVKEYGVYNIIPVFISNLTFIIAILNGFGIESWFYTTLLGCIIQCLFTSRYILKYKLIKLNSEIKTSNIWHEMKQGLIFMPQALGFWIHGAIDRLLISNILGNIIVGYYMFVFQLSTPIIILSTVINLFLTSKINHSLKIGDIDAIKINMKKFSILLMVFSILNYFSIVILIDIFFYDKYSEAINHAPFIVISMLLQALYLIHMNVFYYIGKKKFISLLVLVLSMVKSCVAYLFINIYAIKGVFYTNIILNLIVLCIVLYYFNVNLSNWNENVKKNS
ncbi:lipopolysaccharide biosynthesis protein [Moritella marina]|uniref:lipopolysaccharide biosynthesis protein n=1 Tax=Moritella marina TaxID=90736 RepID=UPI00370473BB